LRYCLDTSALVGAWVRAYPIDVFPGLWAALDDLANRGTIVCPEEVREELSRKSDDLYAWVRERSGMVVPLDGDQMDGTREVLAAFPRLVGALAERNRADPFVIALARARGLTVVTEERGGTPERPRIPLVCAHFGVRSIGTLDFIRELGVRF